MKRFLVILFVLTGSLAASCRCSDKPDVPPVDDDRQARVERAATATSAYP